MTDAKLAELAAKYKELKAEEEEIVNQRKKLGARIDAELARRGTQGIITGGWKITRVTPETVVYDERALRRKLKLKFNLIARQVVDADLIGAAVQEGEIDLAVVNACSSTVSKASYVLVNPAR